MPTSLADLPIELLDQVVSHFEVARTLSHLSLTCKSLHSYVKNNGYNSFTFHRFASFKTPLCGRDATHALTTLSRAWDRKGFVASPIYPDEHAAQLPRKNERSPARGRLREQTIGYQPVIDCYEEHTGTSWTSKREILVWGAGAQLNVRLTNMGEEVKNSWQNVGNTQQDGHCDQYHHRNKWIVYKDQTYHDGRDDITSVSLLRSFQKPADDNEYAIVGRASGDLSCISISTNRAESKILGRFRTGQLGVRSAHISTATEPLLAASLADGTVVVYPVYPHSHDAMPNSRTAVIANSTRGRTWSTSFLSPSRLAVGLGPSKSPLHIYDLSSAGISSQPLRKFSVSQKAASSLTVASVYAIVPVESRATGDVFLSGWYDGSIKTHDLRSPTPHTAIYTDPIDTYSAIYSLLPIGRDRFLAGSARHSILKVFDFRMPGSRAYFASDIDTCVRETTCNQSGSDSTNDACYCPHHTKDEMVLPGYNVFLDPHNQRRKAESPLYTLASAAAYSPRIYAGLEGRVLQLDVVEIMDKYPDGTFGGKEWLKKGGAKETLRERYDPWHRALRLAAVEKSGVGGLRMGVQREIGDKGELVPGWDERWSFEGKRGWGGGPK